MPFPMLPSVVVNANPSTPLNAFADASQTGASPPASGSNPAPALAGCVDEPGAGEPAVVSDATSDTAPSITDAPIDPRRHARSISDASSTDASYPLRLALHDAHSLGSTLSVGASDVTGPPSPVSGAEYARGLSYPHNLESVLSVSDMAESASPVSGAGYVRDLSSSSLRTLPDSLASSARLAASSAPDDAQSTLSATEAALLASAETCGGRAATGVLRVLGRQPGTARPAPADVVAIADIRPGARGIAVCVVVVRALVVVRGPGADGRGLSVAQWLVADASGSIVVQHLVRPSRGPLGLTRGEVGWGGGVWWWGGVGSVVVVGAHGSNSTRLKSSSDRHPHAALLSGGIAADTLRAGETVTLRQVRAEVVAGYMQLVLGRYSTIDTASAPLVAASTDVGLQQLRLQPVC